MNRRLFLKSIGVLAGSLALPIPLSGAPLAKPWLLVRNKYAGFILTSITMHLDAPGKVNCTDLLNTNWRTYMPPSSPWLPIMCTVTGIDAAGEHVTEELTFNEAEKFINEVVK